MCVLRYTVQSVLSLLAALTKGVGLPVERSTDGTRALMQPKVDLSGKERGAFYKASGITLCAFDHRPIMSLCAALHQKRRGSVACL